jgi:hypothetical protein
MTDYLCMLFMGDSIKHQFQHIIQYEAGLERNMGERQGS